MGNRLSRIYTRTGDDGTTGLADGRRVRKDHTRVGVMGDVDELNCLLGIVLAQAPPADVAAVLARLQHELFELGAELAAAPPRLDGAWTARLEDDLDRFNATLPPLREFLLPGGRGGAAVCHLARAVCRRAERRAWTLAAEENVRPDVLRYLNRLSDLLFVLARILAVRTGGTETLWNPRPPPA
jgi:cob(I)alamin adenosyltransferase